MANWRNLFKPWIVERGQAYFECGQVVELEEEDSVVHAKVCGSQEYQVEIRRNGGRVTQMICDCPYAEGGENCKHMAAVLFALKDESGHDRMDWQTALEKLPEEKLRDLLRSIAVGDNALQDRIVRMVAGSGNEPEQWRTDLEQIILSHSDYRGDIVYGHEYHCLADLAQYLEDSLPYLLIDGQVMDAVHLVFNVYNTAFGEALSNDDSGGYALVSEACRNALDQILSRADVQQERKIFYLLHEFLENSEWDWGSDDFEELLLSLDWSAELQQKNLEWLDDNLDSWRMPQRAELMERMGASNTEIIEWWEQRRDSDSAYHPLLQLYEEHDLPKAIALVREKRDRAKKTDWQITDYTKTLLRLLEQAGAQEEYETELRYLTLTLKCQEPEYLTCLKQITPSEQWPKLFDQLLADAKIPAARMRLYHFEGMSTELFTELCQYPSFMDFLSYEAELRVWNPERTLTYYTEILKREMDKACQRKDYRHIIRHLAKMKAYPGGESAAQELAACWYIYHKKPPGYEG